MAKILVSCFLLTLINTIAEAGDPTLVIYLPMDEGSGKTVADLSQNGNDGELEDGPTWVEGKYGKALNFSEGSRVHISASDSLHADIFQDDFTLLAWVKPDMAGDTWQHVWRSVDGSDGTQCTLFLNTTGYFSWRGRVAGTWEERCANPAGMVKQNEWTHVAVVSDRQNFKIYINGVEAASSAYEELDGGAADYYLGFDNREWDERYSGAIDEVCIFTRAMTADQIQQAMEGIRIAVRPAGKLTATWGALKF